jgi:hypothetical protein
MIFKLLIGLGIGAISGSIVAFFPTWTLMLQVFTSALLGMTIGYLGTLFAKDGFDADDVMKGLFCLKGSAVVGALLMIFLDTPLIHTIITCLAVSGLVAMLLLLDAYNEMLNSDYFIAALVTGTFGALIFAYFTSGLSSLIYAGLGGALGILVVLFSISIFFRWTVAILVWLAICAGLFWFYYYSILNWRDFSRLNKILVICLLLCSPYLAYRLYYRSGKFLLIKWLNRAPIQRTINIRYIPRTERARQRQPISEQDIYEHLIKLYKPEPLTEEDLATLLYIHPRTERSKVPPDKEIAGRLKKPGGLSAAARPITDERIGCVCPICGEEFKTGDWVIHCPKCDAVYHDRGGDDNCWEYNGKKCAVYGCSGKN